MDDITNVIKKNKNKKKLFNFFKKIPFTQKRPAEMCKPYISLVEINLMNTHKQSAPPYFM